MVKPWQSKDEMLSRMFLILSYAHCSNHQALCKQVAVVTTKGCCSAEGNALLSPVNGLWVLNNVADTHCTHLTLVNSVKITELLWDK